MIDFKQILCPVDRSEFSRRALQCAVALARRHQARVTVLSVRPLVLAPALWMEYPVGLPLDEVETAETTEKLVKAFIADSVGADAATVTIREGSPAAEILRVARELRADVIVMGTHGAGGFERLLLGSVTENVLHRAACPVLAVPPVLSEWDPTGGVGFRTMLCAIDFSRDSYRALQYALSLAQHAAGRVVLVHALEQFDAPGSRLTMALTAPFDSAAFRHSIEHDARSRLKGLIPVEACAVCEVVIAYGKASREILRVAAAYRADAIVVGTHGRNAVDLALFGSTAQKVLRRAEIPVLTVPREVKSAAVAA